MLSTAPVVAVLEPRAPEPLPPPVLENPPLGKMASLDNASSLEETTVPPPAHDSLDLEGNTEGGTADLPGPAAPITPPRTVEAEPRSPTPEVVPRRSLQLPEPFHLAPAPRRLVTLVPSVAPRPRPAARNSAVLSPDPATAEVARMLRQLFLWHSRRRTLTGVPRVGELVHEGLDEYTMACNMITGIRTLALRLAMAPQPLQPTDFKTTTKDSLGPDGALNTPLLRNHFKLKDYAPKVFRELRNLFGIDPADYLILLTARYVVLMQGLTGKLGLFFFYSSDCRFIIKTIHHSEARQLLRILPQYHLHVKENPNTLLLQYCGLHRIKMPMGSKTRKVHFVVMSNLFPPHIDTHTVYDLKGSTWGRRTNKPAEGPLPPLKDLNWLETELKLELGPAKRAVFLQQLDKDVALLESVNVMDYSLLVGIHDMVRGVEEGALKLHVFNPKLADPAVVASTTPELLDRSAHLSEFPDRSRFVFYNEQGGFRALGQDDASLPTIYYLGVIDFLTRYSFRKRLETVWRSMSHNRAEISAIPSVEYGERFKAFMHRAVRT